MRIAAITMVYNEAYFVPIWLRHYSSQLGWENLYVLDHGSTDGSINEKSCNHIRIPRNEMDEVVRAKMISNLHTSLLCYFDVVIYTDVDEFIVPRPTKYRGLVDYCEKRSHPVTRCVGIDVFQHDSQLPQLDTSGSILRQRPYGHFSYWESKPLVSAVPMNWSAGFHSCDQQAYLDRDLVLFHLKFADLSHALNRLAVTRSLRWSDHALQAGHSKSHRVSDEEMKSMIERRRRTMSDRDMDSVKFEELFAARSESPLVRIARDYLEVF